MCHFYFFKYYNLLTEINKNVFNSFSFPIKALTALSQLISLNRLKLFVQTFFAFE